MADPVSEPSPVSTVDGLIEDQKKIYADFVTDHIKFQRAYDLMAMAKPAPFEIAKQYPDLLDVFERCFGCNLGGMETRTEREACISRLVPPELHLTKARGGIQDFLTPQSSTDVDLFFHLHLLMLADHTYTDQLNRCLETFRPEKEPKPTSTFFVVCFFYEFLWQQDQELLQKRQWMAKLESDKALFRRKMALAMYVNYSLDIRNVLHRSRSQNITLDKLKEQIQEIQKLRQPFEDEIKAHPVEEQALNNSYKSLQSSKSMESELKKFKPRNHTTSYVRAKAFEKHWFKQFGLEGGI